MIVNEKFRIQERILDYNLDEETNLRSNKENVGQELYYEIDTYIKNKFNKKYKCNNRDNDRENNQDVILELKW